MSKLTNEYYYVIKFLSHACVIHDSLTNKILEIGKQCNGLFSFFVQNDIVSGSCNALNSASVWHRRLVHTSDIVLCVLKSDMKLGNNKKVDICDIFHKAKQSKELFLFSECK